VPLAVGSLSIWKGVTLFGEPPNIDLDSHFRYLSGLLFAIGLAFLYIAPAIEKRRREASLLSAIVFIGALARLESLAVDGWPSWQMIGGLSIELVLLPLLWLWQGRIIRLLCSTQKEPGGPVGC
jgi:hypothetical protein